MASISDRSTRKKSTNVRSSGTRAVRFAMGGLTYVSPTLAGHVAAHLFQRPGRHQRPSREHGWLMDSARLRFQVGGEEVAGWAWGEGPTVLLLHGWEGRGAQLGALVRPLVELGHRVIAVDGPGHGESTGQRANPVLFADTIVQVERLFGPLHGVVAHSFGALATMYAMKRGLSVRRVAFVAPGYPPLTAMQHAAKMIGASDEVVQHMLGVMHQQTGVPVDDIQEAMTAFDPGVPMFVVHDEDDAIVPLALARGLVGRLSQGDLMVTTGLGHFRILRDPHVVRHVAAFVADENPDLLAPRSHWHELVERGQLGMAL